VKEVGEWIECVGEWGVSLKIIFEVWNKKKEQNFVGLQGES
jgi:hypothetical protein